MGTVQINPLPIDGPELAGLSDRAFRLWVSAITWQSRQSTDGWVPYALAKVYAGRRARRYVDELVAASLWIPLGGDEYTIARKVRGFELWRPGPSERSRPPIDPELRRVVYERDGFACLHCGSRDDLSLDHIYPFSLGGKDAYENLQTLCRPCNSRKGARV